MMNTRLQTSALLGQTSFAKRLAVITTLLRKHGSKAFAAVLGLVCLAVSQPSLAADEYQKVTDATRENIDATPYVAIAYGFIWIVVFLYVVMIARGQMQVRAELARLQKKIDADPSR